MFLRLFGSDVWAQDGPFCNTQCWRSRPDKWFQRRPGPTRRPGETDLYHRTRDGHFPAFQLANGQIVGFQTEAVFHCICGVGLGFCGWEGFMTKQHRLRCEVGSGPVAQRFPQKSALCAHSVTGVSPRSNRVSGDGPTLEEEQRRDCRPFGLGIFHIGAGLTGLFRLRQPPATTNSAKHILKDSTSIKSTVRRSVHDQLFSVLQ